MFTVGPRSTMAPLARCSDPMTWPYSPASEGSQVEAMDTPAGSWVTPVRPSPTPLGPSSSPIAGMQRLGIAAVSKTYG